MITTVILDFGHVLAKPATGQWFIPPNAEKILPPQFFKSIVADQTKLSAAFDKANKYLNENHFLKTEQEEHEQFSEFYRQALAELSFPGDIATVSKALANEMVFNDDKYIFFSDVDTSILNFKKRFKLGLLSDTWPSLRRVMMNRGLFKSFDSIIMSCDFGTTKESTELFKIALADLGVEANQAIFIDDSEGNLDNAEKVGLVPILMDRYGKVEQSKFRIVHGLDEVERLI